MKSPRPACRLVALLGIGAGVLAAPALATDCPELVHHWPGSFEAVAVEGGRVVGVAVFRVIEKTFSGRELYCDDLVTDEARRSKGAGRAMIAYMDRVARERGCDTLALDSGCQRQQAHKFYFREGLVIGAFHFSKKIT